MNVSPLLDLLLLVVLLGYVAYGINNGLARSVFVVGGIVAGIIAAMVLAPAAAQAIPFPQARVAVTILTAIGLIAVGHAIGAAIGRRLRRDLEESKLRGVDRIAGGLVVGLLAALVISTVSFSVAQLGVPVLSRTIAGSAVIRTIQDLTPHSVQTQVAQLRTALATNGLPFFNSTFGADTSTIPDIDTDSPALAAAAQSVVRITGNAYSCGQSQSGTGFVVARERVVTNAHVVAGTDSPVIEALNGQVLSASIVYFDPADDLAVLAVPGLTTDPLRLGITVRPGTSTAIEGYPYGGPLEVKAALVQHVTLTDSPDIYGNGSSPREVYSLAGQVRSGNSGGPLLSLDGEVVGTIFARSADDGNVGYALTLAELEPVVDQAASLASPVASGACVSG